jgi:hypothetical protein
VSANPHEGSSIRKRSSASKTRLARLSRMRLSVSHATV